MPQGNSYTLSLETTGADPELRTVAGKNLPIDLSESARRNLIAFFDKMWQRHRIERPLLEIQCHLGGIGRRSGFKIHRSQGHPGSSPGGGTTQPKAFSHFFIKRSVRS